MQKQYLALFLLALMSLSFPAGAANDPKISTAVRQKLNLSMNQHIKANSFKGKYMIYDAIKGEFKYLKLKRLHTGVVKKGGRFFVSCADFVDAQNRLYDIDFLVIKRGSTYQVVENIVHALDGQKRKYHLENN